MFQNQMKQPNDPFEEMGKIDEKQISEISHSNPFESQKHFVNNNNIQETHFVEPHYVQGHYRGNGTYVDGYWRDGDGNTQHDLTTEQGGGYDRTNPDGVLTNNLGFDF